MPRTMRELLQLFALYDAEKGLPALLDRLDYSDVRPHQIYQLVHGRNPESLDLVVRRGGYDAREHLTAALYSVEFQENILRNILLTFTEKQRDVFIHVPKCAGTDLVLNLGPRRLLLPRMIEIESWIDKTELFLALHDLMQAMPYYDRLFVYGHISLSYYIDTVGVRAGDEIFSVIRNPFELMLSQANYAVTRMRQDPLGEAPDTREFMNILGIERLPDPVSIGEMRELVRRSLSHPEIAQPNRACFYLGGEEKAQYEPAMTNVVMHNVELTTTEHYRDWLQSRWSISTESRHNKSDHWLTPEDVTGDLADMLRQRTAEDCKFFGVVSRVLEQSGRTSIRGADLAENMGSSLFDAYVNFIAEDRAQRTPRATAPPVRYAPVTVQGRDVIAAHRQDASAEPFFDFDFGIGGRGQPFLREGWASPESGFTWTAASMCRLELPKPDDVGSYRLRFTVGPYVANERHPLQRLTVISGGIDLGTATATERSLIEFDVPQPVLGGRDMVELMLVLPDAVRPRDVTGGVDERLLAFAVERLELLYLGLSAEVQDNRDPVMVTKGEDVSEQTADDVRPISVAAMTEPSLHPVTSGSRVPEGVPPVGAPTKAPAAVSETAPIPAHLPVDGAESGASEMKPSSDGAVDVGPALDRRALMMRFESLGENCELGLVQRHCGAEPLGLFRFASAPFPKLIAALEARFEGLGAADQLEVELSSNGTEYMVRDHRFGFLYHAWVLAEEMRPEDVHRRELRRLPLLIRKLIEDLSSGEKIFVYHQMDEPLTGPQAEQLLSALRAYGSGTLLWVELADDDHPPGAAEWVEPGLIKAYVDRFAPGENAHDISLDCWLEICRTAYRLWNEQRDSDALATERNDAFETVEA
jgi:hypothetical protein